MATPKINEKFGHVQNDPHRCKIKLENFYSDILHCYGVINEGFPAGGGGAELTCLRYIRVGRIKTQEVHFWNFL